MNLTLVIPGRPMNANDRSYWRVKARQTAQVRRDTAILARAAWGTAPARRARLRFLPDDGPEHVGEYHWLPATKTGRDELVVTITGATT